MSTQLIEIPILNFKYHFRPLSWFDEFNITFPKGKNQRRILLAHALADVSDIPVENLDAALKVLDPIPTPLISRMFVVYRGNLRQSVKYAAAPLYKAPEPSAYAKRVREEGGDQEASMDRVHNQLETMYGPKEVAEARALEQAIVERSKDPKTGVPRGAIVKPREELDEEDRKQLGT